MRFSFFMGAGLRSLAVAAVLGMGALPAQQPAQEAVNPLSTHSNGLRLQSVSAFLNYYWVSEGVPLGPAGNSWMQQPSAGATATFGYTRFGERSGISVSYTPSYVATWQNNTSRIHNHSLSFNWRRNLTSKWTYTLAGSGVVTSLTDALFLPTTLANVAAAPASFEELSAAMVGGRFTNNQLAAILTGAAVVESPAGMQLYGSRMMTSALQTGISYARSSRLTFHLNVGASRSQALNDSSLPADRRTDSILSHSTAGSGNIGMGYSLSPRTQLAVDWSSSRTFSNLQDAYIHSANLSLARTVSERWFLQGHAGAGFVTAIREYYALPNGPQYQAGASIGYRARAHTFLASVERSIADTYGFGAAGSVSASGAWNWTRPGSAWATTANFGQQWLTGTGFPSSNNWRATFGLVRSVGRHVAVSTQYAYLSDSRFIGGPGSRGGQHSVRLSVSWLPGGQSGQF